MGRKWMSTVMFFGLALVGAACSSGSSTPSTDTATLGMTITQSDSQVLTSLSKGAGGFAKATVDLSTYSIKCLDGSENSYTGTISAAGVASVANIPTNTPVVCYLLDSNGAVVTQLTISDSTVMGSQYDAPKLSANTSNTVVFNPAANGAIVTPDANTAASTTPASTVDPTGSYAMTCVGVFNESTGAESASDTTTYCGQFASQSPVVYLHRISATQGGNTNYGIGAWKSQAAYALCGSTEGIDNLPSGMALADSTQGAAFSWDSSFSGFSSSSTTNQIANMIAAFGDANAAAMGAQTYTAFRADPAGNCAWMDDPNAPAVSAEQKTAMCTSMYYWQVISSYFNSHPDTYCVPLLNVAWTTANNAPTVELSAMANLASSTAPLNRYQFMPIQFMTNSAGNPVGRMSSKEFWTFSSYNNADNSSVDCIKTVGMLIEFAIPSTTPVAGDQITAEFNVDTVVSSTPAVAANTTLCNAAEGSGSEMAPNGYFLRVTMTKQ